MKKILLTLVLIIAFVFQSCSGGKRGYDAYDFIPSHDPEVHHQLGLAAYPGFMVNKKSLGSTFKDKSFANSSESMQEGQRAMLWHNTDNNKYYIILLQDGDTKESIEEWCKENCK